MIRLTEMLQWLYDHQRDDDQLKVDLSDDHYLITVYNERQSHVAKGDYRYDLVGRISAIDGSVLDDQRGKLIDLIVDHFANYYDSDGRHDLIRGIAGEVFRNC